MFNSQQRRGAFQSLLAAVLVVIHGALFAYVWYSYYKMQVYGIPFFAKGDLAVEFLFALVYWILARFYGAFDVTFHSMGELTYSHAIASAISCVIIYIVTALLIRAIPNVLPMLALLVALVLVDLLWSWGAKKLTGKLLAPRRVVLIYGNDEAGEDGREILRSLPGMFKLLSSVSAECGAQELQAELQRQKARAVMLCGVHSSLRNELLKYCIDNSIEAYVRPSIGDLLLKGARDLQMNNLPVMLCHRSSPSVWYLVVKRVMDILLSLIALVIFSPIMLVTAIAIKVHDGGPVFYKQLRLTKDRKTFYVYKFRSMRVDAEKDGVARLAQEHDDRITPVGRIIRMLRIDEMPQLFCILLGHMSIVGPRPERPEIAEQYEREMPEFALRLQAKAGLTGLAQVYGKYNTRPYNKLQMDLQYIGSMGIITDLKIMFATVKILFMPESTEGVAQGAVTAMDKSEE